jgi:FkbM family methyltransferase
VYTIGVGRNIEWDKAMIAKFGTVHHGWDPTPSARGFFEAKPPPKGFVFHEYGLAVDDGNMTMKLPVGNKDSYTALGYAPEAQDGTEVSMPVLRLESMLKIGGHDELVVLKIDVEGAEFAVIADWAKRAWRPPARQVLFEFHERYFTKESAPGGVAPKELVPTAVRQMRGLGFELLFKDHWEYTFVRSEKLASV